MPSIQKSPLHRFGNFNFACTRDILNSRRWAMGTGDTKSEGENELAHFSWLLTQLTKIKEHSSENCLAHWGIFQFWNSNDLQLLTDSRYCNKISLTSPSEGRKLKSFFLAQGILIFELERLLSFLLSFLIHSFIFQSLSSLRYKIHFFHQIWTHSLTLTSLWCILRKPFP